MIPSQFEARKVLTRKEVMRLDASIDVLEGNMGDRRPLRRSE
jgi:hypothetical protein